MAIKRFFSPTLDEVEEFQIESSTYGLKFLERAFACWLVEVAFIGDPTSLGRDNMNIHLLGQLIDLA